MTKADRTDKAVKTRILFYACLKYAREAVCECSHEIKSHRLHELGSHAQMLCDSGLMSRCSCKWLKIPLEMKEEVVRGMTAGFVEKVFTE